MAQISQIKNPSVEIVPAVPEDLPEISRLAGEIWRAVYPGIISGEQIEYMLGRMYGPRVMAEEMRAGVCYCRLVVEGVLSGFAAWGAKGRVGECKLHKLYVVPALHGRGMGSRVLGYVMGEAKGAGFLSMVLNVNKRNGKAIEAYRRNGFVVRASVCDDIGGGFVMDDFVMGREL